MLELGEVLDFTGGEVETDGVEGLHFRVGEANGAAIVRDAVVHALRALGDLGHTAQLVRGLLLGDLVHDKTTLGVVEHAEVLLGLLDLDHVLGRMYSFVSPVVVCGSSSFRSCEFLMYGLSSSGV